MRLKWIILCSLFAASAMAQWTVPHRRAGFAGLPNPIYLVEENCEGTGLPSGWTNNATAPNWDYTTTVLQGTQSMAATASGAGASTNTGAPFTAQSSVDLYTLFRTSDVSPASGFYVWGIMDISSNDLVMVGTVGGKLKLSSGVTDVSTVTSIAANTTYHVWISYVKGTGSNAVVTAAFSTDGIRPTTGSPNFCSLANGNGTTDARLIYISNNDTRTNIWDRILVKPTAGTIGNNP